MDNQRARIARLTMMALRRGLVLLGLLHLSRLFPLQFERLVLGGQRPECAGLSLPILLVEWPGRPAITMLVITIGLALGIQGGISE